MAEHILHAPSVYKKIAKHKPLTDLDVSWIISDGTFAFHTLIHTTSTEHVCTLNSGCACAYEFEYCEHIDNAYNVDADMYDRLCSSLQKGKCPHVHDSNSDMESVVTKVSALHVAIAANNRDVYTHIHECVEQQTNQVSKIFQLSPFSLAVTKQRFTYLDYVIKECEIPRLVVVPSAYFRPASCAADICKHVFQYSAEYVSLLKLSIQQNDIEITRILCSHKSYFQNPHAAVAYAIVKKNILLTRILIWKLNQHISKLPPPLSARHSSLVDYLVQTAILCNDSATLNILTKRGCIGSCIYQTKAVHLHFAHVLKYKQCFKLLHQLCSQDTLKASQIFPSNAFSLIVNSTKTYPKELCCSLLRRLADLGHNVNNAIYGQRTPLMVAMEGTITKNYEMITLLLDIGSDLNIQTFGGQTALSTLIEMKPCLKTIELVKRILYKNPRIPPASTSNRYMKSSVKSDSTHVKYNDIDWWNTFGCATESSADDSVAWLTERSITYALWECGYPMPADIMDDVNIHPALVTFIDDVMSGPRNLKQLCRDTLRKHFCGLHIHNFVALSGCPDFVKRYILIDSFLTFHETCQ